MKRGLTTEKRVDFKFYKRDNGDQEGLAGGTRR